VRFACLKIKLQHRSWGPDVVLAELAKRPWARPVDLPGSSQIGAYFRQFGERLLRPRVHKQLPQDPPLQPAHRVVHACWQMDTKERKPLPGFGKADLLELIDTASGIKIGAFLFPSYPKGHRRKISWPQIRQALRQAFTRWGLPDRIRTDRERVLVAEGDYPFPLAFSLWLTGLAIEHEVIRRVTQNGGVERAHRTSDTRLTGYGPFEHLSDWQSLQDYEYWRMNAVLPSRGGRCRRQPPLQVYPQARQPRRWYRPEDELQLFDLERVFAYLSQGKWFRHTSQKGQFSFAGQKFNLGSAYGNCQVQITHLAEDQFQVTCPPSKEILKVILVKGLTVKAITGLGSDEG
jgi:hypothetical protein